MGYGLAAQEGPTVEVLRGAVHGARQAGIFGIGSGTRYVLTDVTVEDTLEAACAPDGCAAAGGVALCVTFEATVDASRFRLTRAALCGVQIANGAEADLREGEVSFNPIGANVQTEGFDIARIQDRVLYRDNDTPLDSSGLAVPETLGALE